MKKLLLCLAMLCGVAATSFAGDIKDLGDSKYELRAGDLTLVVDAAHGGKVLSFKYKDTETISQSRFPESFGSTFWTSPQKEWNWPPVPEYDKQPYTVEESGAVLKITSQVSEKLKFQIGKEFAFNRKGNAFVVTYTITNKDSKERKVAPWEITRVPNEGFIFFDAKSEEITPANLIPFKPEFGAVWYATDATNENRKINADGKGWLAYCNNGLMMVKKFADLDKSQPAPGEAEIQVYVNRGKTYIELESQGAYRTLQPGESLTWTVNWMLVPVSDSQPSKKLLKTARKLAK